MLGDKLKLLIFHVFIATHFTARILEGTAKCSITESKTTKPYPSESIKLSIQMTKIVFRAEE